MPFYWRKEPEVDRLLRKKGRRKIRRPKHTSLFQKIKHISLTFLRLFTILLAIGIVSFVLRTFYFFILESDYFRVEKIIIEGVNEETKKELATLIGAKSLENTNIFRISTSSLKKTITEKMPKLADVEVKKLYPSKILITARVRKPLVYLGTKDLFLIDREGVVIEQIKKASEELPDLPFITGIDPGALQLGKPVKNQLIFCALEVLIVLKRGNLALYNKISEINVDEQKGLTIVLLDKTKIRLGYRNLRQQLAYLDAFLRRIKDTDRIEYVDFRFKDQIVYMPSKQESVAQ